MFLGLRDYQLLFRSWRILEGPYCHEGHKLDVYWIIQVISSVSSLLPIFWIFLAGWMGWTCFHNGIGLCPRMLYPKVHCDCINLGYTLRRVFLFLFLFLFLFRGRFWIFLGVFLLFFFSASLLFCFSAFLLFAFPAFCFCCFFASLLYLVLFFSASLLSLLLCFFCLCASVPFYFTILHVLFFSHVFLLL